MTHDELIAQIEHYGTLEPFFVPALRAVVELHKPMWDGEYCAECHPDMNGVYPCSTIQAIEKELK